MEISKDRSAKIKIRNFTKSTKEHRQKKIHRVHPHSKNSRDGTRRAPKKHCLREACEILATERITSGPTAQKLSELSQLAVEPLLASQSGPTAQKHARQQAFAPALRARSARPSDHQRKKNKKSHKYELHEKNLNVRPLFMLDLMRTVQGRRITQQPFIHEVEALQRHLRNQPNRTSLR